MGGIAMDGLVEAMRGWRAANAKAANYYVHRWHVPIKVMVEGVVENWYYAPHYNPRHVPVIKED